MENRAMVDAGRLRKLAEEGYLTGRPHPTADLIIWNYTAKTQYTRNWTPETMMCRGLITTGAGEIVARPFPKFFNYEEHMGQGFEMPDGTVATRGRFTLPPIPLEPFTVTEKMDGSLGILYFADGKPTIATRGSFTSDQAVRATRILRERYGDFPFSPHYTYLFEIILPENRIVIDYGDMTDLVLLATIYTKTGDEHSIYEPLWHTNWPFPIVRRYDGITDIEKLRELKEDNKEGFVVRFESGLRLKLKFAEYVRLHRMLTGVNAKTIWELLKNDQPFNDMLDRVPDEFYTWVVSTARDLEDQYLRIEDTALAIYQDVKSLPTRKEQAAIVVRSPYAAVVFKMLDEKDYSKVIWGLIRPKAERPFKEEVEA